jgi:hypothetical protein
MNNSQIAKFVVCGQGYSFILQNFNDLYPLISVVVSMREKKRMQRRSISTSLPVYFPAGHYGPKLDFRIRLGGRFAHFYE